jgi:hypothetical protein
VRDAPQACCDFIIEAVTERIDLQIALPGLDTGLSIPDYLHRSLGSQQKVVGAAELYLIIHDILCCPSPSRPVRHSPICNGCAQ